MSFMFADYCRKDAEWLRLKALENEAESTWRNHRTAEGPCVNPIGAELEKTGFFVAWNEAMGKRVHYQAHLRIHDSLAKGPE